MEKIIKKIKSFIGQDIDNIFFEQALDEVENNKKDRGVWARALALMEGNENKAVSKYIQIRSEYLQNEENFNKDTLNKLNVEEQQIEYELSNEENFREAIDSAINTLSSTIGWYLFIGCILSVLHLIALLGLITSDNPDFSLLLYVVQPIILLLPYFIFKKISKKEAKTLKQVKERINNIFVLLIFSSVALVFFGVIVAIFLIYKCIIFNKKTKYKI